MNFFDISIIIVNYNTRQLLQECLESIYDKTSGVSFEIIVVDNASGDDTIQMLQQEFPLVEVIALSTNIGFGKANNWGVKQAKGEYLFFLNSDTILLNNAIKMLHNFYISQGRIGLCGGHLYTQALEPTCSDAKIPSLKKELQAILATKAHKPQPFHLSNSPYQVECVIGADMLIKKDLFIKIGGFHPDFFMYAEEVELSCRLKQAKYSAWIVPEAKIIHLEGMSGEGLSSHLRKSTYSIRWYSKFVFFRLVYSPFQAYVVYSAHILKSTLALIFYHINQRKERINYWQEKKSIIKQAYNQYKQFYKDK